MTTSPAAASKALLIGEVVVLVFDVKALVNAAVDDVRAALQLARLPVALGDQVGPGAPVRVAEDDPSHAPSVTRMSSAVGSSASTSLAHRAGGSLCP